MVESSTQQPALQRVGLVAENDRGEVQVTLRRRHRTVSGAGHQHNRLLSGGGAVGDARMAQVMEWPDVVGDV